MVNTVVTEKMINKLGLSTNPQYRVKSKQCEAGTHYLQFQCLAARAKNIFHDRLGSGLGLY